MDRKPTPFNSDVPLGNGRAIIRRKPDDDQEVELVGAI